MELRTVTIEEPALLAQEDTEEGVEIMIIAGNKLKKRKDGTWELRITSDGERNSFYGKTQEIVKEKYALWREREEVPKLQTKRKEEVLLKDWITTWYETYKKPTVTADTFKIMTYVLNKHIINTIGDKPIKKVTNALLQETLNNIDSKGNTTKKVKNYLGDIFKRALQNDLIKKDPTLFLTVKKFEIDNSKALTREAQELIFKTTAVPENLKKYYIFVLLTGQRRSEALRFNAKEIRDNYIKVNGTKTKDSKRYIPYFDGLKEIFGDEEIKFDYKPDFVTRHFKKIFEGQDISYTVRDLRKTFSTNCHEKGISPKVVQKWLGHTNISMTMNTYTEVRPEFELSEASKVKTSKVKPKKEV